MRHQAVSRRASLKCSSTSLYLAGRRNVGGGGGRAVDG